MKNKILFISHDASRTGAPIVLLHLLKWFKANTDIKFDILLMQSGELYNDFAQLGTIYNWSYHESKPLSLKKRIFNKILNRVFNPVKYHYDNLFLKLQEQNYDIIYGNTVVSSKIIPQLKNILPKAQIIMHVHELEMAINQFCGIEIFKQAIPHITSFITVSNAVKENLYKNYKIDETKIQLSYEFIDIKISELKYNSKKDICSKLNIPENNFIVSFSGTRDWRKGTDLIPLLLKQIRIQKEEIAFLWIGGSEKTLEFQKIWYDLEKLNLIKYIRFIENTDSPHQFMNISDIFVLLSREDPFPLVCLEAAALAKPIICFADSGGMPEFVENNAGTIVPYLDIETLANTILYYSNNNSLVKEYGSYAQKKVLQNHTTEIVASQIFDYIKEFLK